MKPQWIWYYGDFEIYHSQLLHARRQEFGADYPTMWKVDSPWNTVEFRRTYDSDRDGFIHVQTTGIGYVKIDDGRVLPTNTTHTLPKGSHRVVIRVSRTGGLPAAYAQSDIIATDGTWLCGHYGRESIAVGAEPVMTDPAHTPEEFPFSYEHKLPVRAQAQGDGILYDFGVETFGVLNIDNANQEQTYGVYYGESKEEALDTDNTLVWERVSGHTTYRLRQRAFRFLFVRGGTPELRVSMDYEYLPLPRRGAFRCDRELLNQVWETSAYTFHLNTREFFLDGIKRDRWVWSGDAYQSYMVNNYLFFDQAVTRRTMLALRGKDPVEEHINTILDYSFYWVIGLWNYYMACHDTEFLSRVYDKAVSLMRFCMDRTDENGFVIGLPGEWVFVDWADMDKTGAVAAEQMLYLKSLQVMADMARLLGKDASPYAEEAEKLASRIDVFFWDEERGAYIDSYASGRRNVTRHANVFAILLDIADEERCQEIYRNVLCNDAVPAITTPYFKFFELDALCRMGDVSGAVASIESYWGGMIRLGATTIWEQYDPTEQGVAHYAMYGSAYGRSLCHAWGGGPIYLLGRYVLGVSPTSPGYDTFAVEPHDGGIASFHGVVPLPDGEVHVWLDETAVRAKASRGGGDLHWRGQTVPLPANEEVTLPR